MNHRPIITILTDFGLRDGFVGLMKGVMLQIVPDAHIVDISHDLPSFAVSAGGFLNNWSYGYFPQGTVHLCVVDPGVGTKRRVLILETQGHLFVAPDNGLLSPLLNSTHSKKIFTATNTQFWMDKISNTFHGRDIFSPIAAHLARGIPASEMGNEIDDPVILPIFKPLQITNDSIETYIRYIDHFGNLVTNLEESVFMDWCSKNHCKNEDIVVQLPANRLHGISNAFGDKEPGKLLAVFGGFDRMEIAVSKGNAAVTTGLGIGDPITIHLIKTAKR
jgi:S-adenosylmethionine hydrolase